MIKGLGKIKENLDRSADILKLKSGESKTIRIMSSADDIIAAYEHVEQINGQWRTVVCPGRDECPLCQSGKRASFKAFIPVLDKTDDKVRIFKANKKTVQFIIGLVEEYGDLTKRDFKLSRVGDGLDTTYQLFPRDPSKQDLTKFEVPDIESMASPADRDAILAMLNSDPVTVVKENTDEEDDELPF